MSHEKWVLTFRPEKYGAETRPPMTIGEGKAEAIRAFLHDKRSNYLDLTDESGRLIDTVRKSEIDGLRLAGSDEKAQGMVWVCDYGVKHPMSVGIYTDNTGKKAWSAKCGCEARYGSATRFFDWCQLNFKISHPHQITEMMRDKYTQKKT